MFLLLLTIGFLCVYTLLILYYKRGWQSLEEFFPVKSNRLHFVSVVVPARNEEKNISALLHALQKQTFPQTAFEIIVVDDFSTDNTAAIVQGFLMPNLLLIQPKVNQGSSSKKKAIEAAIHIAKGELIVTTDADCIPPVNWLQTLHDFYVNKEAAFIAAPVKFLHNNSVLQVFQTIDFLMLQGITAASVASGFHSMCNGANLAYTKQAFGDVNGFKGIDKVATGDDMLLMHKIWKQHPYKVFYLKAQGAIVTTEPMLSWKDFFMQRKRWASKTLVYDDKRIIAVLAFVYLFNLLFFVLVIAAFYNSIYWWYALGFITLKFVIEWPFVTSVTKFYREQKLMNYFFFFQPLHIFYTVVVGALSQFGKYEWKGRRTK